MHYTPLPVGGPYSHFQLVGYGTNGAIITAP